MRIGIFTDAYKPLINGVVTSICTLEQELRANGHTVYIITNGEVTDVNPNNEIIYIKSHEVPIKSFKGFRYKLFVKTHVKDIANLNLDLIHIHTEMSMGRLALSVLKELQLPTVYTYHTMYEDYAHHIPFFGKGLLKPYLIKFFRWYTNLFVSTVDQIIIPSSKVRHTLERYNANEKIIVLPTGLDLNKFKSENYTNEQVLKLKSELGINDERIFLFVGRIAKEKSLDVLLTSFAKCNLENFKFVIVGDGPGMEEIKLLIKGLSLKDNVIMTGFVNWEDIGLYYQMADVFVNASETETQGLTYIEALASSLPVVCRYDENLIDLIQNYNNGILYFNENELQEKIEELVNNEQLFQKLQQNSAPSVSKYSKENFYKQMIKIYEDVLTKNNNLN